jgi:hypothetical protein
MVSTDEEAYHGVISSERRHRSCHYWCLSDQILRLYLRLSKRTCLFVPIGVVQQTHCLARGYGGLRKAVQPCRMRLPWVKASNALRKILGFLTCWPIIGAAASLRRWLTSFPPALACFSAATICASVNREVFIRALPGKPPVLSGPVR